MYWQDKNFTSMSIRLFQVTEVSSLPGYYEPDAAALLGGFSGNSDKRSLLSFLGKVEYDYQNKYFLAGSVRADGSSRFSPKIVGERFGQLVDLGNFRAKTL